MGKHYVITQLPFCLRVAFQIPTKLSIFIQKYFIPPLWPSSLGILEKSMDHLWKNCLPIAFFTIVFMKVSTNTSQFIQTQILVENSWEPIKVGHPEGGGAKIEKCIYFPI